MILEFINNISGKIHSLLFCKKIMLVCMVISLFLPFYQHQVFSTPNPFYSIKALIFSILIGGFFYTIAFLFGMLFKIIAKDLYKINPQYLLSIPSVLMFILFCKTTIEALLFPNDYTYEAMFNPHLVILSFYYGLTECCYGTRFNMFKHK